jgi:hypothetical protein
VSIKPLPASPADSPAAFELADASAIQAVYRGEGTPEQQKRAMEWIIKGAGQIGGQSYRAGDSHATAFLEGRRFVGAQILSLLAMNLTQLRQKKATR